MPFNTPRQFYTMRLQLVYSFIEIMNAKSKQWKPVRVGWFEAEVADLRQVKGGQRGLESIRPGQGVEDREAHVVDR